MVIEKLFRDNFECKRCGECCKSYFNTFRLRKEDIDRLSNRKLPSRFGEYLGIKFISKDFPLKTYDRFFYHPEDGTKLESCPFLIERDDGFYECAINDIKPVACRNFPFTGEFIDLSETICQVVDEVREDLRRYRDGEM
ncbi:MAG: Fe-S-cluster containining protein [Candidatus Methanohalarchaeum thermophilum]|uniref:Fe-S-cluster containining protein n=1 Tax=Methanohalarchaeum thermophilum TaxID=1903181 RepID=A0A1Q6DW07_METT1|nr:MAG: Fe-S-cluster containining protein [Candidatus Methanohalarchaeum thermophilum]